MKERHLGKPDYILLFTIVLLLCVGFLALASASAIPSKEKFNNPYFYLKHQIVYGLLPGLAIGIILYFFGVKLAEKFNLLLMILTFLFLILVFLPIFGLSHGGAQRWLDLGPISFQPAELAKIAYILFLAKWLQNQGKNLKTFWAGFIPFLAMTGILAFLIVVQPAVGTTAIILLTSLAMFFAGGGKVIHVLSCVILGFILLVLLIKIAPYRAERLQTFLDPTEDPLGKSYQVNQALIAIGSGGILGLGPGNSGQRYNFIPEPMGDSIFAIYAEETGFVGSSFLIILFVIFAWRGLKIAMASNNNFSKLVSIGIIFWITMQAFINIAGISKVMPLTGVPMPFVSYGGTALAIVLGASGLLLNISKNVSKKI